MSRERIAGRSMVTPAMRRTCPFVWEPTPSTKRPRAIFCSCSAVEACRNGVPWKSGMIPVPMRTREVAAISPGTAT